MVPHWDLGLCGVIPSPKFTFNTRLVIVVIVDFMFMLSNLYNLLILLLVDDSQLSMPSIQSSFQT